MGSSRAAGRPRTATRRRLPRWASGWAGIGRFCSAGAPTRTCWPPGTPRGGPFKDALNHAGKYVASSNPAARLAWPNSTLLAGEVPAAVAELKRRSGTKLVVMGSGVLIGSLMAANLIDEYLLMIAPLVLGAGRRLFPEGVQVPLRLADSVITSTGVVIASYELTRD
jgi:dihydrofolate reductase